MVSNAFFLPTLWNSLYQFIRGQGGVYMVNNSVRSLVLGRKTIFEREMYRVYTLLVCTPLERFDHKEATQNRHQKERERERW